MSESSQWNSLIFGPSPTGNCCTILSVVCLAIHFVCLIGSTFANTSHVFFVSLLTDASKVNPFRPTPEGLPRRSHCSGSSILSISLMEFRFLISSS